MSARTEFSLQQENILDHLKSDQGFFIYVMGFAFQQTAELYDCQVRYSKHRILDCWDYWKGDIRRTKSEGFSQKERASADEYYDDIELDHFKQAAFLAFWLRRTSPIIGVYRAHEVENISQERFFTFANEISAFRISILLCGYYEIQRIRKSENVAFIEEQEQKILSRVEKKFSGWENVRDYAMTFRHKNMSPHAINLILKSIFR